MNFILRDNNEFPEIKEYYVKNASIGFYGYITKGFVSLASIMPADYYPLSTFSIIRNTISKKRKQVAKPALSIVNSWYDNFYHFAWESLVKLYLLRDQLNDSTVVFPAIRRKYHNEWMQLLGITDITYVEQKERIDTPLAISSSFVDPEMKSKKKILEGFRNWVLERMTQNGLLEDKSKYPEKIFITRTNARYRKILNSDEVLPLVTSYGYTVVELEDYTLAQQINLFYHAEDIVGVHGAGFTHIGFSKAPVLDIIVENFTSDWFEKLSGVFGTGYEYMRTKGVENDFYVKTVGYHDMIIDITVLKENISRRLII